MAFPAFDGPSKKKPAFLRKKAEPPMAPSDGAEDEMEMESSDVTCPKCGCEFDPAAPDEEYA